MRAEVSGSLLRLFYLILSNETHLLFSSAIRSFCHVIFADNIYSLGPGLRLIRMRSDSELLIFIFRYKKRTGLLMQSD